MQRRKKGKRGESWKGKLNLSTSFVISSTLVPDRRKDGMKEETKGKERGDKRRKEEMKEEKGRDKTGENRRKEDEKDEKKGDERKEKRG